MFQKDAHDEYFGFFTVEKTIEVSIRKNEAGRTYRLESLRNERFEHSDEDKKSFAYTVHVYSEQRTHGAPAWTLWTSFPNCSGDTAEQALNVALSMLKSLSH